MTTVGQRIQGLDWSDVEAQIDERGYALTVPALSRPECNELVRLYADASIFRSRIVMQRHNFGRGEYQYFRRSDSVTGVGASRTFLWTTRENRESMG